MPDDDEAAVRAALAALGFAHDRIAQARIARLSGLTNRVYKVELATERLCVRVPGAGTAEIIDRQAEEASARAAAEAGVAPEVLYFGPDGVMVTRFLEADTMSPEHFRGSAGAVERAASALRRLHEAARPFPRSFDLFGTVDRYADLLSQRGAKPQHLDDLLAGARRTREILAENPAPERPCHCDPSGGNLLDTGERVFLIDWEYSARNDPIWDLAYLAPEARFDAGMDERLLRAYFGRPPTPAERRRMALYKPTCDLLAALWALIQHASGNRAADFAAYAQTRLSRARTLMRLEAAS
jgi:thiamine kinase-like enzyme